MRSDGGAETPAEILARQLEWLEDMIGIAPETKQAFNDGIAALGRVAELEQEVEAAVFAAKELEKDRDEARRELEAARRELSKRGDR